MPEQKILLPTGEAFAPDRFIRLEGRRHGDYEYGDLDFSMHRLPLNEEVEQALRTLNLYYSLQRRAGVNDETRQPNPLNPHKDIFGENYLGYLQHEEAFALVQSLGGIGLTLRQFLDFRELLFSGKAFNGKGDRVPKETLDRIRDDIFEVRKPWRAEHLNAKFEQQGDEWLVHYQTLVEGKLVQKTANIGRHLRRDVNVKLANANDYGIPTEEGSDCSYLYPRNKSVARFFANSGRADLNCYGDPSGFGSSLGVHFARSANA